MKFHGAMHSAFSDHADSHDAPKHISQVKS